MRVTKLLALAAVAVVAVACNGISPTSPNATVASDDATALGGAAASSSTVPVPIPIPGCRDITEVQLRRLPSPYGLGDIKVQATYLRRDVPIRCTLAPKWSSRGLGRLSPTRDPFVVTVTLARQATRFQVIAEAPNGVRGSIFLAR